MHALRGGAVGRRGGGAGGGVGGPNPAQPNPRRSCSTRSPTRRSTATGSTGPWSATFSTTSRPTRRARSSRGARAAGRLQSRRGRRGDRAAHTRGGVTDRSIAVSFFTTRPTTTMTNDDGVTVARDGALSLREARGRPDAPRRAARGAARRGRQHGRDYDALSSRGGIVRPLRPRGQDTTT